jgi:hypothetical protein
VANLSGVCHTPGRCVTLTQRPAQKSVLDFGLEVRRRDARATASRP